MKKLVSFMLLLALVLTVFASPALANESSLEVKVNLEDLDSDTRDRILYAKKKAEQAAAVAAKAKEAAEEAAENSIPAILKPENAEVLAGYGAAVANTIKQVCSTLNVEVNEFVKTPVGMITAGLIFYKVAGEDMLPKITDFISKWVALFFAFPLWAWGFRRMHLGRKLKRTITGEDGKTVNEEYVDRYDWEGSEAEGISYFIFLIGFAGLVLFGIFLG